jgi:glycine betaine/proline transport system ATP-binding protein
MGRDGYRGVVTRDAVSQAIAADTSPTIDDIVIEAPSIDPGASLAEALPATLSSEYPLAVIDADGELAGVLSPDRVGEALTPPAEEEDVTKAAAE